jgi:hypothetical protein
VWNYRALWVFGIILALVTAGGASQGMPSSGAREFSSGDGFRTVELPPEAAGAVLGAVLAIGVALLCVIIVLVVVTRIARYVSETALIRMANEHEETGNKHGVSQGLRMGWSRAAWRLFLIDLLIGLPMAVATILLLLVSFAPLLLWATGDELAGLIGTLTTGGLSFAIVVSVVVVGTALSLLTKFFWRACALEDVGVSEGIRRGFGIVRRHLVNVIVMWFLMVAVQVLWVIVMIALTIVLLPIMILLIGLGGGLGALPALAVFGLASLFFEGAVPWVLAAVVGIPIFVLTMMVVGVASNLPGLFLSGLMEVFKSSVWTLTYRELCALESAEARQVPELEASGLKATSAA